MNADPTIMTVLLFAICAVVLIGVLVTRPEKVKTTGVVHDLRTRHVNTAFVPLGDGWFRATTEPPIARGDIVCTGGGRFIVVLVSRVVENGAQQFMATRLRG